MDHAVLIKAFGAFFAVMNPFVNLPIFLTMTNGFSASEQRVLAAKVIFYCAVMSAVVLLAGNQIIAFFGISVDQFRVAGGAVLAHIAWSLLNGAPPASHHGTTEERDELANLDTMAFYPLTFPIIVGPGTIATAIIYAGQAKGMAGLIGIAGVVGVILLVMFVVFYFAAFFGAVLRSTMRMIMTRIMGMILLAIAIEMLTDGLKALWPGLA